jgi:cytochrome c oxidase assembly protein subunit 15
MHLSTAGLIYSTLLWTSFQLLRKPLEVSQQALPGIKSVRLRALITLKLLIVSIFSGCIVAGIDAGKTFNTWPDMNGAFIPAGVMRREPAWRNFFENHGLVQFNHRYIAYSAVGMSWLLLRSVRNAPLLRLPVFLVVFLIHWQLVLGITNVLNQSKLHTASAHQCVGFLTLSSLLYLLRRCRVVVI